MNGDTLGTQQAEFAAILSESAGSGSKIVRTLAFRKSA
jgi:hypothetical protein